MQVQRALAIEVQDLSSAFTHCHTAFVNKLAARNQRQHRFQSQFTPSTSTLTQADDDIEAREDEALLHAPTQSMTQAQHQLISDNARVIEARDRDITQLHDAMQEINSIYRDLAVLIDDQGVTLDRIEDHILAADHNVSTGTENIGQANKLHKKAVSKTKWIMAGTAVAAGIIGLSVFLKTRKR